MRRMYTKNQLSQAVADFLANNPSDVAEAIGLAGTVSNDIGVKPVYQHTIFVTRQGETLYYFEGYLVILNNSSNAITVDALKAIIKTPGFTTVVFSGLLNKTGGAVAPDSGSFPVTRITAYTDSSFNMYYRDANNIETSSGITIDTSEWAVNDLCITRIN